MATNLITEQMRNPQDNSWIPLRQIVQNDDGSIDVLYLDDDGNPLNVAGPLAIENGKITTATDITTTRFNLGAASMITTVLPAGYDRLKGNFNGDGLINTQDIEDLNAYHVNPSTELDEVDLWAGEVYADGKIDSRDPLFLAQYVDGIRDSFVIAGYCTNWTWDDTVGLYCYDIQIADITTEYSSVVIPLFEKIDILVSSKCIDGAVRIYATEYPTIEIPCSVFYIPDSSNKSFVDNHIHSLNSLGITWGEDPAPSTGTANTIYIQLIEAE